jgi:hypothetical protein
MPPSCKSSLKSGAAFLQRAHALTLEIAAEARAEWGFATDILARAFRERRDLASSDRRMVAETVYGLLRWERRLEAIVEEMLSSSRGRREIISAMARQELKLLVYEAAQRHSGRCAAGRCAPPRGTRAGSGHGGRRGRRPVGPRRRGSRGHARVVSDLALSALHR